LEGSEACCTLGVQIAPDGNSEKEFVHLKSMATEWENTMEQACLTHNDSMFSLRNSILLWKLAYPLVVITFNAQQCMEIMQPLLHIGLPKIGFVCTISRAVVHGPLGLAGLNIPNLYMEQLVSQLTMLFRYGDKPNDTVGVMIRAKKHICVLMQEH